MYLPSSTCSSLFSSLETAEDLLSVHLASFLFFLLPPQLFLTLSSSVVLAFGVDPSSDHAVLPRSLCLSLDTSTWTHTPLSGWLQKRKKEGKVLKTLSVPHPKKQK